MSKKIIENLIELKEQFDKLNTAMVQTRKDLNKKLNFILLELGGKALKETKEEMEGSEEYPYGGTVEPYDIERDKDLTE